jgi:tetratricopeptide (TPR) repeat protein
MALPPESSKANPLGDGLPAALLARLGDRSQLDFDIEFFGRVLDRSGDFVDVLRCQGQLLSRKGLHKQALKVDRRLVDLRPDDGVAHYNLACSLALLGHSREAVESLRRALHNGYIDYDYLETDRDLDTLRDDPEYVGLLQEFGIGEA